MRESQTYFKIASRLMTQTYILEVYSFPKRYILWIYVGQMAAKLQAVKVRYLKKILLLGPPCTARGWWPGIESQSMELSSNLDGP